MRSRFSSLLHPLAKLVGVAEDLLLLVAEPLELALDLLARLFVLGGFEGRLQFLEAVVQVALALGQLAQPVEHLARLALLLLAAREPVLVGSGRPLLFVAVLVVRELELLELPLRRAAAGSAALPLPRVVADHLELAGAELEQGLVGGLLGDERRAEGGEAWSIGRLGQPLLGVLHELRRLVELGLRLRRRAAARRAPPPARSPSAATR